jgi:hypothetical protein
LTASVRGSGSAPPHSRAGVALLVVLLVFVGLKYLGTTSPWKLTHWLFSYEIGFVKRGLVGTLMQASSAGGVVSGEAIVAAALAIAGLFLLALGAFAYPLFAGRSQRGALAIGTVALLSPGVGFLLSDLGRFDILNLTLCLLVLSAASALGRFPAVWFVAVSFVALLIHEAALLLCLPMLFVTFLELNGQLEALLDRSRWPRLALVAAPPLLLFVALASLGFSDRPLPELAASLAAHADFEPSPRSAYVLLRPLRSNVAQVLGTDGAVPETGAAQALALGSADTVSFWLIVGVAALQLGFAHLAFAGCEPARRRAVRLVLTGCFLAPLPLMIVGVDWSRWVAAGSVQCAVLMLLFARSLPAPPRAPTRNFVLATLLVVVLLAGAGIPMQGARRGIVMSPQAGVLGWLRDHQVAEAWYLAFARSLAPSPRARPAR